MKITNGFFLKVTLAAFTIVPLGERLCAQTPLLQYTFNGSGTTSANSGSSVSGTNYDLTFKNSSSVDTNLYGAAGSGVSGLAGDLAFDNTASTGMGAAGVGGRAQAGAANSGLAGLTSFTLTGWFKTDSTTSIGNTTWLINNLNAGNTAGFGLNSGSTGALTLNVNGVIHTSTGTPYSATQTWTFFAVSYNSITTTAIFYNGSISGTFLTNVSRTLNGGPTGDSGVAMTLGNISSGVRPLDGYLDNIRIYGSTLDGSGALSAGTIQAIMNSDISPIPEPATATLFFAGISAIMVGMMKSRQRRDSRKS